MGGYPKGSEVMLVVGCGKALEVERECLEALRRFVVAQPQTTQPQTTQPLRLKERKDIGREYFEGSLSVLIPIIWPILLHNFVNISENFI